MRNTITEKFIESCKELYYLEVERNPNNKVLEEIARETTIILPKNTYTYDKNPIIDLVKNYEIKTFDIGHIHFYPWEDCIEMNNYITVGFDGAGELIAIDKKTLNIVMIDGYGEFIDIWCNSAENFLNNLLKVGKANILDVSIEDKIQIIKEIEKETRGNKTLYKEMLRI